MSEIRAAQSLLGRLMLTDSRLALANVVAWLDPTSLLALDENDFGEEGNLTFALLTCRRLFPEVYASTVQLLWQDASARVLADHLCCQISRRIAPISLADLDQMRGGIPVDARGIDWSDASDEVLALLADFRIDPNSAYAALEDANRVVRVLVESLGESCSTYRDIATCLLWLHAMSGNTLVDMSNEEMWESGLEMPDWTIEDLEFCMEMTEEALTMLEAAQRGLDILQTDSAMRMALRRNIRRAYRLIAKKGDKANDQFAAHFKWPHRSA